MPGWAGSRLCSFPHLKLCSLKSKPNLKNQGGSLFWLSLGSHGRRVQFFLDTTHTCPGLHSDELLLEAGVQPQSFGAFLQGHGQDGGRVGGGAWAPAQSFEPESHCCSLEPALHLWGSGSQSTASRTPPIGPLSAWTVSATLPEAPGGLRPRGGIRALARPPPQVSRLASVHPHTQVSSLQCFCSHVAGSHFLF